jgi:hypothetical protein
MKVWGPPTDRRPHSFGGTVRQTSKLLGQHTPRSGRRQFLYTAARGRPIEALANQRPQLQLRLQLVRTQPSSNGIKCRPPASSFSQLVSDSMTTSTSTSINIAAPPSAGVRLGSGPTYEGSNSTHCRQLILPA